MTHRAMYHDGNRQLQDAFDSRRMANRLEAVVLHPTFIETDRAIIEGAFFFFLATADASGHPDCSYKGGLPGFVRVVGPNRIAWPDYDGNGMFKSLGNILVNPFVGLLFIKFDGERQRLRVNGIASVHREDPLIQEFPGAQLIVRVKADHIFGNCPRYIHKMVMVETSAYAPRTEYTPPDPLWKSRPEMKDYLPRKSTDSQTAVD